MTGYFTNGQDKGRKWVQYVNHNEVICQRKVKQMYPSRKIGAQSWGGGIPKKVRSTCCVTLYVGDFNNANCET